MVDSGILLLKYWLEVSADEQTRRLESRIDDPRKIWKLSDMDLKSYSRWYDYSTRRDEMFAATDTAWAPWFEARDERQEARPAQHHHASAVAGAVRGASRTRGRAPETTASQRLRGVRARAAPRAGDLLTV